jgi:hypothetical protein
MPSPSRTARRTIGEARRVVRGTLETVILARSYPGRRRLRTARMAPVMGDSYWSE